MPGPQDPNQAAVEALFGTPQGISGQQILQQGEAEAKMIDRERPDPPPARKALVKAWGAEVGRTRAKSTESRLFDRMKGKTRTFASASNGRKIPKRNATSPTSPCAR